MPDDETKTLLAQLLQRLEAGQPANPTPVAPQPVAAAIDYDQLAAKIAAAVRPAQPVSTGKPISDYGAPVGNAPIVSWRTSLSSNPIGMSKAERRAMDMELGAVAARNARLAAGQIQAQTIKVIPPRRTEQDAPASVAFDHATGNGDK